MMKINVIKLNLEGEGDVVRITLNDKIFFMTMNDYNRGQRCNENFLHEVLMHIEMLLYAYELNGHKKIQPIVKLGDQAYKIYDADLELVLNIAL